jgi:hypothetical protein
MDGLRMIRSERLCPTLPCGRCGADQGRWDRIVGKVYCPSCEEALAQGDAPPLVEPTRHNTCAICKRRGTVPFLTFPLHSGTPVEIDLCAEHLRALLGRRLLPHAFQQLRRRLQRVKLSSEDLFLLHEAFYDDQGRALQPVADSF